MSRKQKKTATNLLEVQNAAKTLFANIRFQSVDHPIKTILITSTVPDEGKTTTAWYLAQAIATAGHSVLLAEGDMRRCSLANMLQIHPPYGLFAVLSESISAKEAIVPTSVKNLFFLNAEPHIPNPADLLASKRMAKLNSTLAQMFEYVIYDTPPVGTFVDAAVLGSLVDGAILVVRTGKAKRSELQQAYSQLATGGTNIIGLCATFVEGSGSEYYYSYYTKGNDSSEEKKAASQIPSGMRTPLPDNRRSAAPTVQTPSDADVQKSSLSVPRNVPDIYESSSTASPQRSHARRSNGDRAR